MGSYWTYRLAEIISRLLPRRFAYWIGLRLADLFYFARAEERAIVMANIQRILTFRNILPAERHLAGTARKTYQYFGKYLVDFFRTSGVRGERLLATVSIEQRNHLDQAIARGKGVLVLSAHFGNWELGGAVLRAMGHDLKVVVRPDPAAKLERLLSRYRHQRGFEILPVGQAARAIFQRLKQGGLVAVLGDRPLGGPTETSRFFGSFARMPSGPALIACRTGATVLPTFLTREEDDTYRMRFHSPLIPSDFAGPAALQEAITRCLECEIGERPHQWFVFHDFWAKAS